MTEASAEQLRRRLLALTGEQRVAGVQRLGWEEALSLDADWPTWAHDGQCAPEGDWRTWVLMAGRGFGKTLAGSQWVLEAVRRAGEGRALPSSFPFVSSEVETRSPADSERPSTSLGTNGEGEGSPYSTEPLRIALIGATVDEARRIMVEGKSGLLAVAGPWIAGWHPSRRLLKFTTGAEATLFSGASPEALRGPEHHLAWCDELAKWEKAEACWDMLQLGLRLGAQPRTLVTTTPRAGAVLKRIMAEEGCVMTGGATHHNPHLPGAFVAAVERLYGGTRLGRQEIEGELITDAAGALWTVEVLARCRAQGSDCAAIGSQCEEPSSAGQPAARSGDRTDDTDSLRGGIVPPHPTLSPLGRGLWTRIVIGVDPPAGDGTCGIVACALDEAGVGHVLADHSVAGRSPEGWAQAVADAARLWGAEAARPERRSIRGVTPRWPERGEFDYAELPAPPASESFAAPVQIVAEQNQGGKMVLSVLHTADPGLAVKLVRASQGKSARAEPVALLFEQGRVLLHGRFAELEAQLMGLIAGGGYEGPGGSPDRADAMVWALTELMVGRRGVPRVRGA